MAPKTRVPVSKEAAEKLAIQALSFIAADAERLGRFLAVSGIGPDGIRAAAREQRFFVGVLDHMLADERLLATFGAETAIEPKLVARAREVLGGPGWEREVP